jgi:hypothetical protein
MSVIVLTLRWLARLFGLLIAIFYTLMVIGEFTSQHSSGTPTPLEWAGIALLTLGVAGMLIAWRWELTGAVVSLAALAVFSVLIHGTAKFHIIILAMMIPGILYCADWLVRRGRFSSV